MERSVEFHEQAILELERQASVVDLLETRVKELEQFSDIVKEWQLVVAELGKKFEKRVRDVEKLSDLAKVRQLVMAILDDQLEERVLDVEKQLERRATNLEARVIQILGALVGALVGMCRKLWSLRSCSPSWSSTSLSWCSCRFLWTVRHCVSPVAVH